MILINLLMLISATDQLVWRIPSSKKGMTSANNLGNHRGGQPLGHQKALSLQSQANPKPQLQ